ncbi:hypothetical protein SFUMM280S_03294 [Streptomyces fumanus]
MPGTVLLLAAAPAAREPGGRRLGAPRPGGGGARPSGTDTANVVELADPLDPQAVLTRLRAVAGGPGTATVYVTGQLHLDRRQRLPHLPGPHHLVHRPLHRPALAVGPRGTAAQAGRRDNAAARSPRRPGRPGSGSGFTRWTAGRTTPFTVASRRPGPADRGRPGVHAGPGDGAAQRAAAAARRPAPAGAGPRGGGGRDRHGDGAGDAGGGCRGLLRRGRCGRCDRCDRRCGGAGAGGPARRAGACDAGAGRRRPGAGDAPVGR